jgi:spoIIIJ-associated protein
LEEKTNMDFCEKYGTDVDEAVRLALLDLNLTIDDVDVTVLEESSRGFFGIGSKLAKVRVEKKKAPVQEEKKEVKEAKQEEKPVSPAPAKQEASVERTRPEREKAPRREASRNNRRDRDRNNNRAPKFSIDDVKPVIEREPEENLVPCEDHAALTFLKEVTKEMGLDLTVTAKQGKDVLYLDIQGKDSGTIIGKRGQTLDAIQYLTSLVVNKENSAYTRVVVDAENYRAKREKTLELLAVRLANKVARTRKSVRLEPMNPYERKVIHATLQSHPQVTTRSEGQDPYRRVIIELK